MNNARVAVLMCLAALAQACVDSPLAARGVHSMAPSEAASLTAHSKVIVLDVSSSEDYARAHLPNAMSIPRDELWCRVREIPSGPALIVLIYGAHDQRVHSAGVLVADETGDAIYELAGGLQAWTRAGLPVVRGDALAQIGH